MGNRKLATVNRVSSDDFWNAVKYLLYCIVFFNLWSENPVSRERFTGGRGMQVELQKARLNKDRTVLSVGKMHNISLNLKVYPCIGSAVQHPINPTTIDFRCNIMLSPRLDFPQILSHPISNIQRNTIIVSSLCLSICLLDRRRRRSVP